MIKSFALLQYRGTKTPKTKVLLPQSQRQSTATFRRFQDKVRRRAPFIRPEPATEDLNLRRHLTKGPNRRRLQHRRLDSESIHVFSLLAATIVWLTTPNLSTLVMEISQELSEHQISGRWKIQVTKSPSMGDGKDEDAPLFERTTPDSITDNAHEAPQNIPPAPVVQSRTRVSGCSPTNRPKTPLCERLMKAYFDSCLEEGKDDPVLEKIHAD